MRVGVGSFAYRWSIGIGDFHPVQPLTPLALLQRAAALGSEVVQFADNMPLIGLSERRTSELSAAAKALDVVIELGIDGADSANLWRYGVLAQKLRARLLKVSLNKDDLAGDRGDLQDRLRVAGDEYATWGGMIALENHFLIGSAELAALVTTVDRPNVGVCLDVANSIANLEWPEETVRTLAPFALNVHVKDFDVELDRYGAGMRIVGAPMGMGRVDPSWVLGVLAEERRDVNAIVEHWISREAFEAGGIELEDAWTSRAIQTLRAAMADRGNRIPPAGPTAQRPGRVK